MAKNLVIVAIPEEQDRVWKISSEKVPHLTLLFLGDADSNPHVEDIVLFVEHAVEICQHGPFYLDVDHRGTLGPDNADVVFFSKRSYNLKWIKQFRSQLLQNENIRTAYDAAEQYDEWQPHLTMGYPVTPAKKLADPLDDTIYSVRFDRIAVWVDDYNGPEFQLDWPDRELEYGDSYGALAYSDVGKDAVADILEHHGVKGMHWGIRKDRGTGASKSVTKRIGQKISSGAKAVGNFVTQVADAHFEGKASDASVFMRVHNRAADKFNAEDIPRINNKVEYRDANFTQLGPQSKLTKQYEKEMATTFDSRLKESVKEEGTNWSGTRKLAIDGSYHSDAGWGLKVVNVGKAKHSIDDHIIIRLKRDDKGFITDIAGLALPTGAEDSMTQTTELGKEFVAHQSVLDNPDLAAQIKAKLQSILDDVTGDADKDLNLFGDPIIRVKLQSVLSDFYKDPNVTEAMVYSALGELAMEHHGIKGMHWGIRRDHPSGGPQAIHPSATSRVPAGDRRKTKIKTEGGQNIDAHPDAIKVAESKAKLKKSGPSALSNQELRDVSNRVRLESEALLLTSHKGKQFVKRQLLGQGESVARAGLREGTKGGLKKAGFAGAAAVL